MNILERRFSYNGTDYLFRLYSGRNADKHDNPSICERCKYRDGLCEEFQENGSSEDGSTFRGCAVMLDDYDENHNSRDDIYVDVVEYRRDAYLKDLRSEEEIAICSMIL